jgi:putative N6-adenine-specific DNA methylase
MPDLFAVCAPGLEPVLLGEVQSLGLAGRSVPGGVEVPDAPPDAMARMNLWLRTASRVLVRLGQVKATTFPELVRKAAGLPWERCVAGVPVALRVTCRKSRLYHSGAVAERLHTAIEQRLGGKVPLSSSDEDERAQLFVARYEHDVCTVSADSSGALLHQRGYRVAPATAPLRETLAAALLLAARFSPDERLCDPLCGSGTIAIEAALIAMRRAPGLSRRFAFEKWPGFAAAVLEELRKEARSREKPISAQIEASDRDAAALAAARENAARAGVEIRFSERALAHLPPAAGSGLVACNPPYGVRIGGDLRRVYRELGDAARRRPGWRVAAVVADEPLAKAAGLTWSKLLRTQNGGIRVEMLEGRA